MLANYLIGLAFHLGWLYAYAEQLCCQHLHLTGQEAVLASFLLHRFSKTMSHLGCEAAQCILCCLGYIVYQVNQERIEQGCMSAVQRIQSKAELFKICTAISVMQQYWLTNPGITDVSLQLPFSNDIRGV